MKFADLQLHPQLQSNIEGLGWVDCTQVQELSIPHLRRGKDVAGLAQTGTGKTGAFLVPTIDRILKGVKPDPALAESETVAFNEWKKKQFILILVPTRELCEQVYEIAVKLCEGTGLGSTSIYGGTTYDKQIAALKSGVEFVIATPGRLIDLYKEHVVDLGLVRGVVFDEADRMFDMGFKDDMMFILKRIPRDRHMLLFSATMNFDVLNVAYEFGADPVEINIGRDQAKAENVKDAIMHVGQFDKPKYLLSVLKKYEPKQTIIFSNFKRNVELISKFLTSNGVPAVGISSLLTQAQRNRVMEQFKGDNDRNILVATDVAARGLDILGVDLVVNYDLPDDPENYVHRIGRTGRAGQTGTAISLVSDRDVEALQRVESFLKHKVEALWMDDAEIVQEHEPFPRDESRPRFGGGGARAGGGRGGPGGGRGGRDGGRDRGGPGGGRGRGPRDDRGPRGPREDRGPRDDRGPRSDQAARTAGGGAGNEAHRDRNSGRHAGNSNGAPPRSGDRGRGPRDQQRGGGGPGRGGPQGQQRQGQGGRPPQGQNGGRRPHQSGGAHRNQRPQVSAAAAAKSAGIGAKVTGFFKKLFGN